MIDPFFLATSFVTLLVITDPGRCDPVFLAITGVVVAAVVIATFALFREQILVHLGISVPSLQVAGGCCCW
jgi:small neutral amino acid transporter SnatA (MarC family)